MQVAEGLNAASILVRYSIEKGTSYWRGVRSLQDIAVLSKYLFDPSVWNFILGKESLIGCPLIAPDYGEVSKSNFPLS